MSTSGAEADPASERGLQPVRGLSPEEHLERLRHDVDILLEIQLRNWIDAAWIPLADALIEYGTGVLTGWLHSRRIFPEMLRIGRGLRTCPDQWLDDDTIDELVGETIAVALRYFKLEVLMKNRWDASKGASLATFFIGQCKLQFSNVYDRWWRDRHNNDAHPLDPKLLTPIPHGSTDDQTVTVDEVLDRLSSPLVREVARKKYVDGMSYQEIANCTPGVKDAKAAENLMSKERRRQQR